MDLSYAQVKRLN